MRILTTKCRCILALVIGLPGMCADASAADWSPKKGPLMTQWAKDVTPDNPLPEYPRPQLVRERWKNLNGVWQLAFAKADESPPLGKELPERILVPFPVESALSGVMKHADRLWYRRTFEVPAEWKGKRVLLHFGAVDWEAKVWLNGKELGVHRGGYDGFSFDITGGLAASGPQELVVGVFDPTDASYQPRGKQVNRPGGIFYTPCTGIWQTVWMEPVEATYLKHVRIDPDVDAGLVRIAPKIVGAASAMNLQVSDDSGRKLVELNVPAAELGNATSVKIPEAKLWTPETPVLYRVRLEVFAAGGGSDVVESYFGMRKVALGKDEKGVTRILLNNKPYFMFGPLDQGFWPDGIYTAPTDAALKYDIEITKKLGFNTARKHVKVEPDRWYYWCDKLGLLVWQDMPSGDRSINGADPDLKRSPESAAQYRQEWLAIMGQHHNAPSIVMWVPFNEGWGQFDTAEIVSLTKKTDPSRLVNNASGWTDRGVGDVNDMHNYPGPGMPKLEEKRAAVLGEYGGLGLPLEGHTWQTKDNWGYRSFKSREELTAAYEQLCARLPRLIGAGLCAAIYTQTTDVEVEVNGLVTYDRALVKGDLTRVSAANQAVYLPPPTTVELIPTAVAKKHKWRHATNSPAAGWEKADFDDSKWDEGESGFGTHGTPGAVIGTEWKTSDIWIRRRFTFPEGKLAERVQLAIHHDEDAEVYINGVLATKVTGYTTDYEVLPISPEARAAIHAGENSLAIHCHQTGGGQYIDAGLVEVIPAGKPEKK